MLVGGCSFGRLVGKKTTKPGREQLNVQAAVLVCIEMGEFDVSSWEKKQAK